MDQRQHIEPDTACVNDQSAGGDHSARSGDSIESPVPVLHAADPSHRALYGRLQDVVASAAKITVVCGTGISTQSGVSFKDEDNTLFELVELSMTKNYGKFRLWNREMTRMRVLARNAPPGRCHTYIAQLYDAQRLLRCYTQNIDGLQTRDRADMANHVLEMRGTNAELACHLCKRRPPRPAQSFDEIIFRDGFAICPFCQKENLHTKSSHALCLRPTGCLIPDIIISEDSAEHLCAGMSIDEMEVIDGSADLLLVIGTMLHTNGAAKLVKSLSRRVHSSGGAVIFINGGFLLASTWSSYIDLHLETDIEEWAEDSIAPCSGARAEVSTLADILLNSSMIGHFESAPAPPKTKTPSDERHKYDTYYRPVRSCESSLSLGPSEPSGYKPPSRVLLLVCSDGQTALEGQELAARAADECAIRGWECRPYFHELNEDSEYSLQLSKWRSYHLVVVHVSAHIQHLQAPAQVLSTERGILWLLRRSGTLVNELLEYASWSTLVTICAEGELATEGGANALTHELCHPFRSIIASVDLSRFRVGAWASFIADLAGYSPKCKYATLELASDAWMKNEEMFEHTNLFVYAESQRCGVMLLASPFHKRPLGRLLPGIESICPCIESDGTRGTKRWIVEHNAVGGCDVARVSATARCSVCQRQWTLPCHTMFGIVRQTYGRFSVQLSLEDHRLWM